MVGLEGHAKWRIGHNRVKRQPADDLSAIPQQQPLAAYAFFLQDCHLRNASRIAQDRAKLMKKYMAVMPKDALADGFRPHQGRA